MSASQPKKVYRYQTLNARTIESLCNDTLYFADPGSFNDPFDCKPTIDSDSDNRILRDILSVLIKRRAVAEKLAALKNFRIHGKQAEADANRFASEEIRMELTSISYHATDPEYGENRISRDGAEQLLLTSAIEREILKQYDRGVCCFSASVKNPLLWSHYGDQHRGVCIGFNLNRTPKPKLHKVLYGGSRSVKTSLIAKAILKNDQEAQKLLDRDVLLRKAPPWKYEREWRLLGNRGDQVSPLKLVDVTFGLRCPHALIYALVSALEHRDRGLKFYIMSEEREAFKLKRELVDIDELHIYFPNVARSATEIFGQIEGCAGGLSESGKILID